MFYEILTHQFPLRRIAEFAIARAQFFSGLLLTIPKENGFLFDLTMAICYTIEATIECSSKC